jgi:hypothetical protein
LGYTCGAGCVIATAHTQGDRDPVSVPHDWGVLSSVELTQVDSE